MATFSLVLCHVFSNVSFPRYKKLEDLLEKSFSLVKMPSLQPVVMCVMKHLPKVTAAWLAVSGEGSWAACSSKDGFGARFPALASP